MFDLCPYCPCGDQCGRETTPARTLRARQNAPSPAEVYAAVAEAYSKDRTVLWTDPWHLGIDLQYRGLLPRLPLVADVGHAQDLIRDVNR